MGYNPYKKGRPSHHPLVAFLDESGDSHGTLHAASLGSATASAARPSRVAAEISRIAPAVQHPG